MHKTKKKTELSNSHTFSFTQNARLENILLKHKQKQLTLGKFNTCSYVFHGHSKYTCCFITFIMTY